MSERANDVRTSASVCSPVFPNSEGKDEDRGPGFIWRPMGRWRSRAPLSVTDRDRLTALASRERRGGRRPRARAMSSMGRTRTHLHGETKYLKKAKVTWVGKFREVQRKEHER